MKTRQEMCVFILWLTIAPLLAWLGSPIVHAGASAPQTAEQSSIAGEWQGVIAKLRLNVKIDQGQNGALTGKLMSVDQGNITIPIDSVTVTANTVRLEMTSIRASYEGKLNAAGSEIAGTWQQGGNNLPLVFRRPGAAAAGFTLKPRTIGRVPLEPCRTADGNTEGLCGKYEVYENRQTQSGRKIALNIMVLPALAEKPAADPFFPLAGGPGQSAVEAFPLAGYTAKVRQQRDVVLVDQRGTGKSNPLPCELRGANDAQAILGLYLPEEKLKACRTELEKKADLTQYTTSISADDLDEVRQALGYDKINVFGGSYGTRAALVYLRRHEDHVRTLTLEGVAPPQYRIPLAFSRTIQGSVDQLISRCAADAACNKDFPDLKKEFQATLDRLDKSPAHFEVKAPGGNTQEVTLTRSQFVAGLRPLLYVPGLASHFPYMVHRAYQGDWTHYGTPAVAIRAAIDKEIARGMATSVICAEDLPGLSEARIRRETKGTYLGDFQVRAYQKVCREWPQGKIPGDFHADIHSKVPTLFISGALDPATPPEASAQAARDLSNSRVIVVKDGTHGTGSPCIDGLISQFVAQGAAASLDASCVDQIHLPPFLTQSQIDQSNGNNAAR
jgi:pimeloyl-ACP methyl ester carboxylesterase